MEKQQAWIRGLQRGQDQAFDLIYEHYRPRLFGFLLRMTLRQDVAEDLLQETFLRLATHGDRLAEDDPLAAWLYTVARNLALSYHRRTALDAERVGELGRIGMKPAGSPFEALAGNELQRRVERALARMPAKYREALLLVGAEGFQPQEAAAICSIRDAAFRKRLSRARDMLHARLDKEQSLRALNPREEKP